MSVRKDEHEDSYKKNDVKDFCQKYFNAEKKFKTECLSNSKDFNKAHNLTDSKNAETHTNSNQQS